LPTKPTFAATIAAANNLIRRCKNGCLRIGNLGGGRLLTTIAAALAEQSAESALGLSKMPNVTDDIDDSDDISDKCTVKLKNLKKIANFRALEFVVFAAFAVFPSIVHRRHRRRYGW
jgi:hypothetical protein